MATPDIRSVGAPFTVILVNWRNEEQTLDCVRAVKGWKGLKPELLVIDNESTAESAARLAGELAPSQLLTSRLNLGYGGGNNLAIRCSIERSKNYILLLNSDAKISELAMRQLLSRLKAHPELAILGPIIHETDGSTTRFVAGGRDIAIHAVRRLGTTADLLRIAPPVLEVDYVPGTVFLTRSCVFTAVGLLDEHYFFGGEIADFCKRAFDKGYKAYVDLEAEAWHDLARADRLRDTLYAYYSLRNRFLYVRKHYKSQKLIYFSLWIWRGFTAFSRSLLQLNFARARAIALAVAHGLTNRFGNQNGKFL